MPASIFSHQAPGLILKIKNPNHFDGTALCVSTLVPDLNILIDFFLPYSLRPITHSLLGLLIYTIPFTLLITCIFCSYLAPFFANLGKRDNWIYKPLKYFGIDEWNILSQKKYNKKYFIIASYSSFIGGLSHLLLDLVSHETIYLLFPMVFQSPEFLLCSIYDFGTFYIGPFLIDANLPLYQLIWDIESMITLFISLYLLRYIKKNNLIHKWYKIS